MQAVDAFYNLLQADFPFGVAPAIMMAAIIRGCSGFAPAAVLLSDLFMLPGRGVPLAVEQKFFRGASPTCGMLAARAIGLRRSGSSPEP